MSEDKRRLTKVERDAIRDISANHEPTDISDTPFWSWVDGLLVVADAADEENTRHRYVIEELAEANSVLAREIERLRAALNCAMGFARHAKPKGDEPFAALVEQIRNIVAGGDND